MEIWHGVVAGAALLTLAGISRLRGPRRVAIGRRGLRDPKLRRGWIPWEEIEGAYLPAAGRRDTLCIKLRSPEEVEVEIDLAGSGLDPVEVLRRILLSREGAETPRPQAGP
jgi:hypothetical protein